MFWFQVFGFQMVTVFVIILGTFLQTWKTFASARPAEAAETVPLHATATEATVTMVKVPNKSIRSENHRFENLNIAWKRDKTRLVNTGFKVITYLADAVEIWILGTVENRANYVKKDLRYGVFFNSFWLTLS